jgi:hypothetical protein
MAFDPNNLKPADLNNVVSYEFKNIDIIASSCKYISGLNPSDNNDIPIINSNNPLVKTNPGPNGFVGLHVTNYIPPSPNNAFYPSSQHAYRCSDLYIYNKNVTHNITGIDNVLGEIVIKHNAVVSTDPILYLCFLLNAKASTNENDIDRPNEIDNIINFVTSAQDPASVISTSINFSIPKQTLAYQYNNTLGNTIVVFCQAIGINKKSQGILTDFNSNGKIDEKLLPAWLVQKPLNAIKLVEQNITTGTEDNVYMECIPTGVSKEDIKAYNVPINSEYTTDASKIGFMANTMRLTFILFGVFMLYALFPSFWGVITESVDKDASLDIDAKKTRLDSIEFWYYVFLISIALITLIFYAVFNLDQIHFTVSFIAIFMLVLTSFIILMSRRKEDGEHTTFKNISIWPWNANSFNASDVGQVFMELFPTPFLSELYNNKFTIFFVVFLTISIDLIAISAIHKGLPESVSETPSTDPKVMNVQELLDVIFGDIFALIAVRVMYIIYGPAAAAP